MSNRYEIKQEGVVINTIIANEEFVTSNFSSETYEFVQCYTASEVRGERDALLVEVDAIAGNALRWAELDSTEQAAWSTYRQALLDVPQQAGFPNTVTWPAKP
jgi:hypothetical protein